MIVERLTKTLVLVWTCAALALELRLMSNSWPALPLIGLTVGVVMALLGFRSRNAVAPLLAVSYIFPVLVRTWHGGPYYAPHEGLWLAAMVGVMLPDAIATPWRIPPPWRAALVTAVLVVVTVSPVIILREIDLNPGLLTDMRGWSWGGAVWPSIGVTWTLHVSLTLVVGVVWFDWLFGARDLDLRTAVVTPLALSAIALCAVSVYQMTVDLGFLNDTVFANLGRAAGTMYDANVSGTVAALWIGGMFLLARSVWPDRLLPAAGLVILGWLAVWASGSRTAFAAASIVSVFIAGSAVELRRSLRPRAVAIAAVVIAAVVTVVGVAAATNPRTVGPLGRVWATLPSPSVESVKAFAAEMWNRNGYGESSTAMFQREPYFGVGVGAFHSIATDYFPNGLPPDNAQNWLRHQLVEFGLIGSLGWILWFVAFALFVFRARRDDPVAAWMTRGLLIAFGFISMLGMPGQSAMVAITFWALAFWHVSETIRVDETPRALPRWVWAAVVVTVVAAAAGSTQLAVTRMRVPTRALAAQWPYSYGVSTPEASGDDAGYRHARAHAVAVVDAPYRWVTVSVRLANAVDRPVDVRVWTNGAAILKGQLSGTSPVTAIVELPAGQPRMLFEAAARFVDSRRPFFVRATDPRFLVKWEFLDREPAGFNGYSRPFAS